MLSQHVNGKLPASFRLGLTSHSIPSGNITGIEIEGTEDESRLRVTYNMCSTERSVTICCRNGKEAQEVIKAWSDHQNNGASPQRTP
jgi:hypothetical protein